MNAVERTISKNVSKLREDVGKYIEKLENKVGNELNEANTRLETFTQYLERFKMRLKGISYQDVLWLTHQKESDDMVILTQLELEIGSFEVMYRPLSTTNL